MAKRKIIDADMRQQLNAASVAAPDVGEAEHFYMPRMRRGEEKLRHATVLEIVRLPEVS